MGSVKLANLYQFLKDYQNKTRDLDLIYEKNVRKFLGGGRAVNRGIAETVHNQPERFGLYNNGITIVVESFDIEETDKYELTDPYIVNGCQTTKTIWNELKKRLDSGGTGQNAELEEYKERLNKGILVVPMTVQQTLSIYSRFLGLLGFTNRDSHTVRILLSLQGEVSLKGLPSQIISAFKNCTHPIYFRT